MLLDDSANEICIIITGLIRKEYINEIVETYKFFQNKIISTWVDQDQMLLQILKIFLNFSSTASILALCS